jgi:predicted phage baseplate assembly protein
MNAAVDATLRNLNDCGCCEGLSAYTPVQVYNRPGLAAIAYRVGTHDQFKQTLLARLSASGQAALRALNTRDDDDFSIALLDAWATVADVLTFYQERFANESYLRTARERLSVLELVRLIDYELRPGVAASTYLAFALEETPGAFGQALSLGTTAQSAPEPLPPITIDIGTKVQSIPGPGEQAQTFETIEKIEARAEWSAIKPRLTQPQTLSLNVGSIMLQGTATNLKPGDTVLIAASASSRVTKRVLNVTPDEDDKTTRIDFDNPSLSPSVYTRPLLPEGSISDFPTKVPLDESVVQDIIARKWREEDLSALVKMQNWSVGELVANIAEQTALRVPSESTGVFALRQRAAIFGHNAPKWDSLPTDLRFSKRISVYKSDGTWEKFQIVPPAFPSSWETRTLNADAEPSANEHSVYLDAVYPGIIKGSWLVMTSPSVSVPTAILVQVFEVRDNIETTRSDFAISAKVSRLRVEFRAPFNTSLADFRMRTTTVLAQSEQLELADVPITDLVQGEQITLGHTYLGLKVGQRVILTGERSDLQSVITSETMTLKEVTVEAGFTVLTFDQSLAYSYLRHTVTINANVAQSTHGETVQEVLGSGDASQPFQRFTLRQPPLTYISASTPSGGQTTLEVRVNDLLWHEVPTFFGRGPDERIYVTSIDDDGKTTVMFGDGLTGTRLPTGQENVKAKYRKGIGLPGLVKAHQLTQLMTRPLGVKGVTNPLAPSGAADRESLDDSRRNAPLTVLTLGRIVSLQDYEDFARAFSGIDKALATWSWSGEKRRVFVTVAGSQGAEVPSDSVLAQNLLTAMRQAGDPNVPLLVASYEPRLFRLSAALQVHPDHAAEKVLAAVEQRLRESFSFEARSFGQPVHLSEIIAVMQNVTGVVAVDVNELYRTDQPAQLRPRLEAGAPRLGDDKLLAAELLTLDPRPLELEVLP